MAKRLDARVTALEQKTRDKGQGASINILVTWENPTGTFWKWDPERRADRKLTAAEVAGLGAPGTVTRTYASDLLSSI